MTPLKLALLNLSRRKIPSIIAIASIAISIACSGVLLRLNLVSENRFSTFGRGGEAIIGAKAGGIEILLGALNGEGDYPDFLPFLLFESLRSAQTMSFEGGVLSKAGYIKSVIPFVYFARLKEFRVVGTDEGFVRRPVAEDIPVFAEGRWILQSNEVVVGATVAKREGLKAGDEVSVRVWTGKSDHAAVSLKVVGVFGPTDTAWDRMLFSDVQTAHHALSLVDLSHQSIWGPKVLHYFLTYLEPNGYAELKTLVNRRTVGQAILVEEQKARLEKLTGTGATLGLFVTILILALGGLSVTSMLITRFEAMASQLAVLRALGYKKKAIGQWLLWEGFLLGVAACFFGALLDLLGFPLTRSLLGDALPPADIVGSSIFQSVPIWITAVFATTASVFVPLYRVYHQDVHFSLRS